MGWFTHGFTGLSGNQELWGNIATSRGEADKKKKKDNTYSARQDYKSNSAVKLLELDHDIEKLAQALTQKKASQQSIAEDFNKTGKLPEEVRWDVLREILNDPQVKAKTDAMMKLESELDTSNQEKFTATYQAELWEKLVKEKKDQPLDQILKGFLEEKRQIQAEAPKRREALELANVNYAKAQKEFEAARNAIPGDEWFNNPERAREKIKPQSEKLSEATRDRTMAQRAVIGSGLRKTAIERVEKEFAGRVLNAPADQKRERIQAVQDGFALEIEQKEKQTQKISDALQAQYKAFDEFQAQRMKIIRKLDKNEALTPEERAFTKPFLESYFPKNIQGLEKEKRFLTEAKGWVKDGKINDLRLNADKPKQAWPKNFAVATATGQRHMAWGGLYMDSVFNHLKTEKSLPAAIRKTEQANSIIHDVERNGTPQGKAYQVPVSSTRPIEGWKVFGEEKTLPPRKILYIQGGTNPNEDPARFNREYAAFDRNIRHHFGPAVEILRVKEPTFKQVDEAIEFLAKTSDDKTEVMIFMSGHGSASGLEEGLTEEDKLKEGSQIGSFMLKGPSKDNPNGEFLSETHLKQLTQKLAHCKSGLIMIDSCHSGAWIAKDTPRKTTVQPT